MGRNHLSGVIRFAVVAERFPLELDENFEISTCAVRERRSASELIQHVVVGDGVDPSSDASRAPVLPLNDPTISTGHKAPRRLLTFSTSMTQ